MRYGLCIVSSVLALSACQPQSGGLLVTQDETRTLESEFRAKVVSDTNEVSQSMAAINEFVDGQRAQPNCSSPGWQHVESQAALIENHADYRRVLTLPSPPTLDRKAAMMATKRSENITLQGRFADTAARARLAIADAALAQKCLDLADKHYRYVTATFTGSAWTAYRERARIGVDDVRAARPRS